MPDDARRCRLWLSGADIGHMRAVAHPAAGGSAHLSKHHIGWGVTPASPAGERGITPTVPTEPRRSVARWHKSPVPKQGTAVCLLSCDRDPQRSIGAASRIVGLLLLGHSYAEFFDILLT